MLDLTGSAQPVWALLPVICGSSTLPRLKALRIGDHQPQWEIPGFERILSPSILWPDWVAAKHIAQAFTQLQVLGLGYCDIKGSVDIEDVELLFANCTELRHLDLSMIMTFVDFSPAVAFLGAQLESLAVHGLAFDQNALELLPVQCPGLTALSLHRCHFNVAHMRRALSRLPQLQMLGLVGHVFNNRIWDIDLGAAEIDDIMYLVEQCPQLTGLSLEGCGYENDQLLRALPALPLLTKLNIAAPKTQRLHQAKLVRDVLQQCAKLTCLTVVGVVQADGLNYPVGTTLHCLHCIETTLVWLYLS